MEVEISFKRVMYTKILLVVFLVCCMVGCNKEQKPQNVLSETQMINAIIELYIAEERADAMGLHYDSIRRIFPKFEARVFDSLGISDSVFKKSMEFYMNDPKKLERVYTAVVDSLSLRAQELSVATPKGNGTPQ